MKKIFTTTVSPEHLDPDWIDIEISAVLEVYEGSNYPDDPSEVHVMEVTRDGKPFPIDEKIEAEIVEKYFEEHPQSEPDDNQISRWMHD